MPEHVKRLNEQQLKFVSYVEEAFWRTGSLPSVDKTAEVTLIPVSTIKKYWKEQSCRDFLAVRGVNLTEDKNSLLTAQQLQLANMLLNLHDKMSVREKLEECGVSSQQYNAWMRTEGFQSYLRMRAESTFAASDHVAYQALVDAVASSDVSAIKFYFEMRGTYNPKLQVEVNLEMVLTRVIEVIQAHVKDPAMLTAIASDLSMISGSRPQETQAISVPSFVAPASFDL